MSETKVPAIPAPTDQNLRDVARAVKGVLDVREGLVGDPLDRFVTLRELVAGGVAATTGSGRSTSVTSIPAITDEELAQIPVYERYDPTEDLTVPPAPTGFTAVGLFAAIKLDWVGPLIRNYAYTEIWRADSNALGNAIRIGTSNGTSYVDYLGSGVTRFYWARFVSQANVTGPYNSTNGTSATTAQDPEYLLEVLTGAITESQLYQTLGARIDLIDGPSSLPNSVANRLLSEATTRQAAITTESTARQTADTSLAQQITTLTASVAGNAAAIQTEATTRATADTAEAAQRTALAARVTTTEDAITTNAAAIQTEATARATADTALSQTITTLDAKVDDNTGLIQQEATTRATADTANANLISQVQARLDTGDYAAVKTESSVSAGKIGGLEAQYTVKIDVNGHVSGFGLATSTSSGTPTSAFIVRADRFALAGPNDTADPLGTLNPTRLPFVVTNSPTAINGVSVPAGTYINTAFIGGATINKAQIGSIYADRISAGFTSSVDMESSVFFGSELYLGGAVTYEFNDPTRPTQKTGISSVTNPNIALKNTGAEFNVNYFKIKNGTLTYTPFEVVNGVVNIGAAMIGDGTITNAKIGSEIRSTNYVAGSAGWIINKNGAAEFGAASIRGQLTASQIDTRNLTIKDANGTVLFGAGTQLPVAQITGLGSLATQSSVAAANVSGLGLLATRDEVLIGQHVKVYNPLTDSIATVGITDFVNVLSKISSNNISSFMEGAAIGNAYIGNAAVGTLSIEGNAVTVPAVANAFAQVNVERHALANVLSNWQTVVSVTVDFGSVAPDLVLVCGSVNILAPSGVSYTASYMRLRNATNGQATVDVGVAHSDSIVLSNFGMLISGAGVNTFVLEISQENTGGSQYIAASRSISVMGAKR